MATSAPSTLSYYTMRATLARNQVPLGLRSSASIQIVTSDNERCGSHERTRTLRAESTRLLGPVALQALQTLCDQCRARGTVAWTG